MYFLSDSLSPGFFFPPHGFVLSFLYRKMVVLFNPSGSECPLPPQPTSAIARALGMASNSSPLGASFPYMGEHFLIGAAASAVDALFGDICCLFLLLPSIGSPELLVVAGLLRVASDLFSP